MNWLGNPESLPLAKDLRFVEWVAKELEQVLRHAH
jgi:hypothetical protein